MAKKKKPPTTPVVNISLTEIDLVAKGTELANRMKQIGSLKKQQAEENARMRTLIDEQIEIAEAIASQILGGSEARNQASLKVGEDGSLTVPDQPFADKTVTGPNDANTLPEVTAADAERIDAEKVAEGLRVPPAVAEAIAKSGGEVNLSAGAAANGESLVALADATKRPSSRGKKAAPTAPKAPPSGDEPQMLSAPPEGCPLCGSKTLLLDPTGVYSCADEYDTKCTWMGVVERPDATSALGASA